MRIRSKSVAAYLIVALIQLGVLAPIAHHQVEQYLYADVRGQLESVASIQRHRLEQILAQNAERIALVASRTQLRISLEKYSAGGAPEHQAKMIKILRDAQASIADFTELQVVDLEGEVVASTNRERLGAQLGNDVHVERGRREVAVDTLVRDERGRLLFLLAAPLVLEQRPVGVVVARADARILISLVQDYTGLKATGETFIARKVDEGGVVLTPLRFDPSAALTKPISMDQIQVATLAAAGKGSGFLEDSVDYRGKRVLVVARYLDQPDWIVVTKIDRDEAFLLLNRLRWIFLQIVVAGCALMVAVALYFARTITGPIRKLSRTANAIQGGDYAARAHFMATDEIGELAEAFNAMTDRLVRAFQELERSYGELEQFTHFAAHDLREPVKKLPNYCDMLMMELDGAFSDDAVEYLDAIRRCSQRMEQLVDDLRALTKAGYGTLEAKPQDLRSIVGSVLEEVEPSIVARNAQIVMDSLPSLPVSRGLVEVLYKNLVENALKYGDGEPLLVELSAEFRNGVWVLGVRNSGAAIEGSELERMFLPFVRLENATGQKGSGIGLTLCRKIVERHGGHIWVRSTEDEVAIYFTLEEARDGCDDQRSGARSGR